MSTRSTRAGRRPLRATLAITMVAGVAGLSLPAPVHAQRESLPVELTDGPAAEGFDISRFTNTGNGFFETFYVDTTDLLSDALRAERVAEGTIVLVIETAEGRLAFVRDQMAFHHIAQGRAGEKDWMATF